MYKLFGYFRLYDGICRTAPVIPVFKSNKREDNYLYTRYPGSKYYQGPLTELDHASFTEAQLRALKDFDSAKERLYVLRDGTIIRCPVSKESEFQAKLLEEVEPSSRQVLADVLKRWQELAAKNASS